MILKFLQKFYIKDFKLILNLPCDIYHVKSSTIGMSQILMKFCIQHWIWNKMKNIKNQKSCLNMLIYGVSGGWLLFNLRISKNLLNNLNFWLNETEICVLIKSLKKIQFKIVSMFNKMKLLLTKKDFIFDFQISINNKC